jgi:hypothetical protein
MLAESVRNWWGKSSVWEKFPSNPVGLFFGPSDLCTIQVNPEGPGGYSGAKPGSMHPEVVGSERGQLVCAFCSSNRTQVGAHFDFPMHSHEFPCGALLSRLVLISNLCLQLRFECEP